MGFQINDVVLCKASPNYYGLGTVFDIDSTESRYIQIYVAWQKTNNKPIPIYYYPIELMKATKLHQILYGVENAS